MICYIQALKLLKHPCIKKPYSLPFIPLSCYHAKRFLFPNQNPPPPNKALDPQKLLDDRVNFDDVNLNMILKTLERNFDKLKINSDYYLYSDLIYTKPSEKSIEIVYKLSKLILDRNIYCKGLTQDQLNFLIVKLSEFKIKGLSHHFYDCVINKKGYSAGINEGIVNSLIMLMTLDSNTDRLNDVMEILQINNYILFRSTYYHIFSNLSKYGRVEIIHLFYSYAKATRAEILDIDFYSKLIESYSTCNRLDLAEIVIKDLKSNNLKIPAETENLFEYQFNEINRVLNYYHSTLDLLLTGRNKFNDIAIKTTTNISIEEAQNTINELDDLRKRPRIEDFNSLIQSHLNAGNLKEAKWVCKNVEKRKILSNANTFELFINYYCVNKNLPRAMSTFDEMLSFRILPNFECYSILLLLNCKLNNIKEMFNLLNSAYESQLRLNCTVFYSIMKLLVKEENYQSATKVYSKMLDFGVPIAPGFKFRFLMQLFKLKETKLAKELYLSITKEELLTCPNLNKTVFYGHCLFGDIQEILAYYSNWEFNYDSSPNVSILNKSVELLLLRGQIGWVKKVINFNLNINNSPNSNTLSMVLQACVNNKDYDLFSWLINVINSHKLENKLEFKHYKLMTIIYINRMDYTMIINTVEKMKLKGIYLDKFMLNIYITSLSKTQDVHNFQLNLDSVMKDLSNDISKDIVILNEYLIKLIQYNAFEECFKLIENVFVPNNINVTQSVSSNLFQVLQKSGDEELINRFNRLLKRNIIMRLSKKRLTPL